MRKNLQKSARLQTNKVRYSSYVFGLTLLGQLFIIYSMSYFVQEGMITFFLASVAKIIMVMCDGANDVIFGFLSENLNLGGEKDFHGLLEECLFSFSLLFLLSCQNILGIGHLNYSFSIICFFLFHMKILLQ